MTRTLTVDIRGLPRPQGSMRAHPTPSGKIAVRYPPAVWDWRHHVQQQIALAFDEPFAGPVELRLGFDLPRPAGHYGTGRNRATVRPGAPAHPAATPDIDKLVRAISDAITDAGLWKDDGQVVYLEAAKRYVTGPPGVLITVKEIA